MNEAYSALSAVYEKLVDDQTYKKWAEWIVTLLEENSPGPLGYDLACGSGYFTRAEKRAGYDVTGVDICEEMLVEAKKLSLKEKLNITFLRQDMTCLKSFNKVDYITVINDGVNYLSPERLKKAFEAIIKQLKKGGVLIFDFSTEYKLRNIIGDNMFGEDREDISYLWFNKLCGDRIEMDLTVFTKCGDLYKKEEESHVQYIHTLDFILGSLKAVGFKEIEFCRLFGGTVTPETDRIVITAVK